MREEVEEGVGVREMREEQELEEGRGRRVREEAEEG